MRPPTSRWIFRHHGLADKAAMSNAEIDAYTALVKRHDGGRAFLRIMRGFELTDAKQRFLYDGLAEHRFTAQVVRGRDDPAQGQKRRVAVQEALGVGNPILPPGRHFLQEDPAPAQRDRDVRPVPEREAAALTGIQRSTLQVLERQALAGHPRRLCPKRRDRRV